MSLKRMPLDDQTWLVVEPQGAAGAFALACALGLRTIPLVIAHALDYPEWTDVLAKSRGMALAGVLTRFPVLRQHCGCRMEYTEADGSHLLLIVRLCSGHPFSRERGRSDDHIVIGRTEVRL